MNPVSLPVTPVSPGSPPASVDRKGLHADLTWAVKGEVRFDRLSRALYATDASVYQIVPLGVVLPRDEADVCAVVKVCGQHGVPITARGGGTSQAGQAIGPGIILDFSKYLDHVLEINAGERWVRVQPGCVLDDLNLAVKAHGLQFAPDVSTSNRATIGGMIANNSSGAHSIVYGKTVDHVLELRVVLADGQVRDVRPLDGEALPARRRQGDLEGECYRVVERLARTCRQEIEVRYPRILRRVGGYNLDSFTNPREPFSLVPIFVGSEGTLGVVVEAKLRLVELPRARALLVVHFHELLDALAATPLILQHGPAAVEVVDRYVLDSTHLNPEASRLRGFIQGDPGAVLLVEFFADSPEQLPARLERLQVELAQHGHGYGFHRAIEADEQARIWKLRKMALGLSMAQKGDAKAISFVEDSAVSPQHLRDYIDEFLQIVAQHGTAAGVYAHASVGCLHVRPVINLKTAAGVAQFEAIAAEVTDLVLKYGGALSGEHGDGLVRSPFQEKMFGPVLYQAFRELKQAFDPEGLFNPGKIVDAPPLTDNLRYGSGYSAPSFSTTFDFSADGGLVQAAELCAGVGACRKMREGSMCPSYRATRDEQHSTRGRANTLRLALTGQLALSGLTDPAVRDVLDHCLECKACKSECPTNVDMARLKAEFLDQHGRLYGLPLRNRLFGRVATFGRWGSRLAPVSNWLMGSMAARWAGEAFLGIDRRRLPPAFARHTLERLLGPVTDRGPGSVLFVDTFTNYFEPEPGLAAFRLLSRLGHSVRPLFPGKKGLRCCGRPQISNGLLREAVGSARHNVEILYPLAAEGREIVACEPSCILTLKDDYPALLGGKLRQQAEVVAAACHTVEEHVETILRKESAAAGLLRLAPAPAEILVQPHCHERSLVGTGPLIDLLRRIPGARVRDMDAGCCGMAGSFGYEQEHFEVSRRVGEHALFPALRRASSGALVAASGFSCRLQIRHFTGKKALHPIELIEARAGKEKPPG